MSYEREGRAVKVTMWKEKKLAPGSKASLGDMAVFCYSAAIRRASRSVARFYDACLAPVGLRTTQYSILASIKRYGPVQMAELARVLAMDRATLGHNLRPLERDGLLVIGVGAKDRRERSITLTPTGRRRLNEAHKLWGRAQAQFENRFGKNEAAAMRQIMAQIEKMQFERVAKGAD